MAFENLTGQKLGQYELRELLGAGGMGAVYRAYQANLKRDVAVKVLPSSFAEQAGYIERFNREAEVSASLEHAHIVPVYDYGTQGNSGYVVMRLLTGGSLAQRLKQLKDENRPLPSLQETADLLKQLAGALDYAHSRGVYHRDIKPGNIMFDNQGSAYIVDFGIAKLLSATTALTATGAGGIGTPNFMPPEQWRGEPLTPAADQYALAVVAYTMLTGRLPMEADTPYALMHKHLNEPPTPLRTWRTEVPQSVETVLGRALEKDPAQRFPSVTAFAQAFDSATSGAGYENTGFFLFPVVRARGSSTPSSGTGSRPPSGVGTGSRPSAASAKTIRRPPQSSRTVWIASGAILLVMLVLGAVILSHAGRGSDGANQPSPTTPSSGVVMDSTHTPDSGAGALAATSEPSPAPAETENAAPRDAQPLTDADETAEATEAMRVVQMATDTDEPTHTPTATRTPRPTSTPRPTDTATSAPSDTPTATHTATSTPTDTTTPTDVPTDTATPSDTPTVTSTPTDTATPVPSDTATPPDTLAQAISPREIALATRNAIVTLTATHWTPTFTPDWTRTIEAELTALHYEDLTATATQSTPTPTPTFTPTLTPTITPSITPTPTLTPTITPTLTPTVMPSTTPTEQLTGVRVVDAEGCPGAPLPRLAVGQFGRVALRRGSVSLLSEPESNNVLGSLRENDEFEVIDGPECYRSEIGTTRWWWYVDSASGSGWVAEGQRSDYWLAPVVGGNRINTTVPACGDAPPSRLFVGEGGRNTYGGGPTAVRQRPGGTILYSMPEGMTFYVEDGPVCQRSQRGVYHNWWFLHLDNGVTGYAPEGDEGTYWLEPFASESGVRGLHIGIDAQIDNRSMELRAGPGREFSVIENLSVGSVVTLVGGPLEAGDFIWWKVRSQRGNEGWVVEATNRVVTLRALD